MILTSVVLEIFMKISTKKPNIIFKWVDWLLYLAKSRCKIAKITESEIIAKLLDPELSGAFLNSVNSSFKNKKEESLLW
jgi:hypothetical protein